MAPRTTQVASNLEPLRAEQRAAHTTVVMVSSDIDRLLRVTDRVGLMHAMPAGDSVPKVIA